MSRTKNGQYGRSVTYLLEHFDSGTTPTLDTIVSEMIEAKLTVVCLSFLVLTHNYTGFAPGPGILMGVYEGSIPSAYFEAQMARLTSEGIRISVSFGGAFGAYTDDTMQNSAQIDWPRLVSMTPNAASFAGT